MTDADSVGRAMEAGGAQVIVPIEARYYGPREGRLRDPFGHLWIVSQGCEGLSKEEVQKRIDPAADPSGLIGGATSIRVVRFVIR